MNPQIEKAIASAGELMEEHGESPDGRATTSPENGRKGGRTPIDWGKVAEAYMKTTGRVVRWRKEGYYEYNPATGAYRLNSEKEIASRVGGFLRDPDIPIAYSVNAERNTVGALRATEDLTDPPPVFLDTGKSAAGWIAMRNGLLNVEAAARGEPVGLRKFTPDFFSTYALPYEWRSAATCPKFMRFIEEAQPDEEGRRMCQMLAGLLLVPDTSYQVFFVLLGDGGCGKSTFMSVLREMVGRENVCRLPLADFTDKFKVGLLTAKLANLVDDAPQITDGFRNPMSGIEGILKEATGGLATMNYEPKGVDADTSRLVTARCVFCQNPPLPPFADRSEALWRRLRVIPFPRRFYGSTEQNPRLAEEVIAEELPGVFAWAVRGLGMLRKCVVFPQSQAGAAIIEEHRGNCDRERTFLEERYVVANGHFIPSREVYSEYGNWCSENGYNRKNSGNFMMEVQRVFPPVVRLKKRWEGSPQWGYLNLAEAQEYGGDDDDL